MDDMTLLVDAQELVSTADAAVFMLQLFFVIVGFIAITLAFFLLWISTTANIRENVWEFGVLRFLISIKM